jgi:hypothetical protein
MVITLEAKNRRDAEFKLDQLLEAKDRFSRTNKPFGSIYHRLVQKLMKTYGRELNKIFQATKPKLKKAKHISMGEFRDVLTGAQKQVKALRAQYLQSAYIIGKERGIAALKRKGLLKEGASDWWIDFTNQKVEDEDGNTSVHEVPVLHMDINPPTDVDLQRIQQMVDGTEYSLGMARYQGNQRGPFVDAQFNKLFDRLTSSDEEDLEGRDPSEPWPADDVIDDTIDAMEGKAKFWSNELHAVSEKAAINEWKDWEKENNSGAQYAWVGPIDGSSCDECQQAVDDSPYDSIDDVPEPGELECQCNCRHMVVLIGPGEEEE